MNSSTNIKNPLPLKKVWRVGTVTVIAIDKNIVERLGIEEDNTLFEQSITDGGIMLRLIRK